VSAERIEPELSAAAWIEMLADWPADCAIAAMREWPRRSRWWPAWHEIETLMHARLAPRLEMLAAMRRCAGEV